MMAQDWIAIFLDYSKITVFPGKGRWKKPNRRLYLEVMEDIPRAVQKDPTV
jgi:hypothetical protein